MVDAVSINGGQVIAVGSEGGYRNLSCADEQVISFLLELPSSKGDGGFYGSYLSIQIGRMLCNLICQLLAVDGFTDEQPAGQQAGGGHQQNGKDDSDFLFHGIPPFGWGWVSFS